LFYYGDSSAVGWLKKGRFTLSTDWTMLQPYLSFMNYHQSKVAPVTEAEIQTELTLEYEKLPETIRSLLSFDDFLQQRDKFEAGIRSKILSRRQQQEAQGYPTHRISQTGFLRLYDSATLDWAWQQLSNAFSGLCIEINRSAPCFHRQTSNPALLKPVKYGAAHDTKPTAENPVPGAFSDVEHNSGHGEWRFIRPVSKGVTVKLTKGDVLAIYVSIHTPTETVDMIRELIALDLRYRSCVLYEVYPDATTWRLTARPI
jgi:hypothetical protein